MFFLKCHIFSKHTDGLKCYILCGLFLPVDKEFFRFLSCYCFYKIAGFFGHSQIPDSGGGYQAGGVAFQVEIMNWGKGLIIN